MCCRTRSPTRATKTDEVRSLVAAFDPTLVRLACCQSGVTWAHASSTSRPGSAGRQTADSTVSFFFAYGPRQRVHGRRGAGPHSLIQQPSSSCHGGSSKCGFTLDTTLWNRTSRLKAALPSGMRHSCAHSAKSARPCRKAAAWSSASRMTPGPSTESCAPMGFAKQCGCSNLRASSALISQGGARQVASKLIVSCAELRLERVKS